MPCGIQDNMFDFDNLVDLDNRSIQILMRTLEQEQMAYALKRRRSRG